MIPTANFDVVDTVLKTVVNHRMALIKKTVTSDIVGNISHRDIVDEMKIDQQLNLVRPSNDEKIAKLPNSPMYITMH